MAKIAILGGDERQIAIAEALFLQGLDVKLFGFTQYERPLPMHCKRLEVVLADAAIVIGPTPFTIDGINLNAPYHDNFIRMQNIFALIQTNQIIITKKLSIAIMQLIRGHDVCATDLIKIDFNVQKR